MFGHENETRWFLSKFSFLPFCIYICRRFPYITPVILSFCFYVIDHNLSLWNVIFGLRGPYVKKIKKFDNVFYGKRTYFPTFAYDLNITLVIIGISI